MHGTKVKTRHSIWCECYITAVRTASKERPYTVRQTVGIRAPPYRKLRLTERYKGFWNFTNLKNNLVQRDVAHVAEHKYSWLTSPLKPQITLGRSLWNRLINGNRISRNGPHGRPRCRCADKIKITVGQKYLKMQLDRTRLRTKLIDALSWMGR
jgi:hypothetical protein